MDRWDECIKKGIKDKKRKRNGKHDRTMGGNKVVRQVGESGKLRNQRLPGWNCPNDVVPGEKVLNFTLHIAGRA
jgi:hypothetical protein